MSIVKGIRGAITVESNSVDAIKSATIELLGEMVSQNGINKETISHVIFTLTTDLNVAFPAKFAREDFGWSEVAMLCFNELDVPDAIAKCLRVLIVLNCEEDFKPKFVYLKGATELRK